MEWNGDKMRLCGMEWRQNETVVEWNETANPSAAQLVVHMYLLSRSLPYLLAKVCCDC